MHHNPLILVITLIFVMIGITAVFIKRGGFHYKEKIEALWKNIGMEVRILEEKFLGIVSKKVIGIKKNQKYLLLGMNWVVSTGKHSIPYWGLAIFFPGEIKKFSIVKRRPNFLDGKRIKLNDPELDKMLVVKCKDEDWFTMVFNEGVLMNLTHLIPKNTIISFEKKFPVKIQSLLVELNQDIYSPFILIKRRETITASKNFAETVALGDEVAKIFLHIK